MAVQRLQQEGPLIWMLADETLQEVLARLPDRVDRQSWCLVCKKFLHLEAVGRKYVHLMRPEILEPVLGRYSQVEHLDLSSCVIISDVSLATVAKFTSPRLLSIKLVRTKGFGAIGVRSLCQCRLLQDVDLTFCISVGDSELVAISELQHLQKLKLTACRNVTDLGLASLARCKELRNLTLKYCTGVGDDGVRDIATGCPLLNIIDLSFTEVSDSGLASLTLLKNLECLSLISCNNVTDDGLRCLRSGCKLLQKLDVAKCSNVSSQGIIALTGSSVQLQELNLSYCKAVSRYAYIKYSNLGHVRRLYCRAYQPTAAKGYYYYPMNFFTMEG